MDPMTIGAIVAGGNLLGGYLGGQAAEGDRNRQMEMLQRAYDTYAGIKLPDIEKMKLTPEELLSAGILDPRMEGNYSIDAQNAYENIALDPRLKQAQMDQLSTLQQIQQMGATPVEKAAIANMLRQQEASAHSMAQQQLEDQSRRGVGSSNAALAARLAAGQDAANRSSQQGVNIAAQMFQNQMAAGQNAAGLAGQMEAADYSRQAALAGSKENRALQEFLQNAQAKRTNVDRFNSAQAANLQNKQNLMSSNVGIRNAAQERNKNLLQQNFSNEMARAGGMAGAGTNLAGGYGNRADRTAGMYTGAVAGAGNIFTGAMQSQREQDNFNRLFNAKYGGGASDGQQDDTVYTTGGRTPYMK